MRILYLGLLLLPFFGLGQENVGVHFQEDSLNWTDVQVKAKATHKYILVDCATTWCGYCKQMKNEVFPTKEAGDYFNDKFISISVQMDETAADNETARQWRSVAAEFASKYRVHAYPTFLIFNEDGGLALTLEGSTSTAGEFISLVNVLFNPDKQYHELLLQYQANNADTALLRQVVNAVALYETDTAVVNMVLREFLSMQTDLCTSENLALITRATHSSTDPGFAVLAGDPLKADKVLGKSGAEKRIWAILGQDGTLHAILNWSKSAHPDLDSLRGWMGQKYTGWVAEETIGFGKTAYYLEQHAQREFQKALDDWMNKYSSTIDGHYIEYFISQSFSQIPATKTDASFLKKASEWISVAVQKDEMNPEYRSLSAFILYQRGQKDKAVAEQEKALSLTAPGDKPRYRQVLNDMKEGKTPGQTF